MHRFYLENLSFDKKNITITDGDEIHHMRNVLRLKTGDGFNVFNGQNQEVKAQITKISDKGIEATIKEVINIKSVRQCKITLACAVPKKSKFEFIIEKCTELGVSEIIPLCTKRSDVIFSKEKLSAKQERFTKVAVNAAKQCKRVDIPPIAPMTDLKEVLLKRDRDTLAIFPSLGHNPIHIKEAMNSHQGFKHVYIFIGPEGDFTPQEVAMAQENGCIPVTLGKTVLKVDTAAIATVAFVAMLSD